MIYFCTTPKESSTQGNGVKYPRQEFWVESHVTQSVSLEGDVISRIHNTLRRWVEVNQGDVSSVKGQVYIAMGIFEKSVNLCCINGYTWLFAWHLLEFLHEYGRNKNTRNTPPTLLCASWIGTDQSNEHQTMSRIPGSTSFAFRRRESCWWFKGWARMDTVFLRALHD